MVNSQEVTAARSDQRKQYRKAAKFSTDALRLEEEAREADEVAKEYVRTVQFEAASLKEWERDMRRETARRYRDLAAWHLALARGEGDNARKYELLAAARRAA